LRGKIGRMPYKIPFPVASLELAAKDFEPPPPPIQFLKGELALLAEDLFQAIINHKLLTPWLRRLAKAFDATLGHIALGSFETGSISLHALAAEHFEITPDLLINYEDVVGIDERASLAVAFPGRAIATHDFDPARIEHIPVVQMTPPELAQMLVLNDVADPYWAFLSVLKHRDAPTFTRQEKAEIAGLGVAFSYAMSIYKVRQSAVRVGENHKQIINTIAAPLAIVEENGRLKAMNSAAQTLLGLASAEDFATSEELLSAVNAADTDHASEFALDTISGLKLCRVSKLGGSNPDFLLEFEIRPDSLILRTDRFCAYHRLSRAESEIVKLLSVGEGIDSISKLRSTSRETVRAQLRSIRDKTGLKRQEQLLTILLEFDRQRPLR